MGWRRRVRRAWKGGRTSNVEGLGTVGRSAGAVVSVGEVAEGILDQYNNVEWVDFLFVILLFCFHVK